MSIANYSDELIIVDIAARIIEIDIAAGIIEIDIHECLFFFIIKDIKLIANSE